jgi:hypothetical protein
LRKQGIFKDPEGHKPFVIVKQIVKGNKAFYNQSIREKKFVGK